MGPFLYFNVNNMRYIDDTAAFAIKNFRPLMTFLKARFRAIKKRGAAQSGELEDLNSLIAVLMGICEAFYNAVAHSPSSEEIDWNSKHLPDYCKDFWREYNVPMKSNPYSVLQQEITIAKTPSVWVEVGPYITHYRAESRKVLWKLQMHCRELNQYLERALKTADPYKDLRHTSYDLQTFKMYHATMVPFLNELVERKYYKASELFDPERGINLMEVRRNHELIRAYLPYVFKANRLSEAEAAEALAASGFGGEFVWPKRTPRIYRAMAAAAAPGSGPSSGSSSGKKAKKSGSSGSNA